MEQSKFIFVPLLRYWWCMFVFMLFWLN